METGIKIIILNHVLVANHLLHVSTDLGYHLLSKLLAVQRKQQTLGAEARACHLL